MIGRSYKVGIAKESTRGTVATPTFWIPLLELSTIENKAEYKDNTQSIGVIADSDGAEIVKERAEGGMDGKVLDKSIGLILLATTGTVSSATKSGETTVYEHTFTFANTNQHQSLTVEIKNDNEQLAHALAMINSFSLSAEMEDYVKWNAEVVAKKGVSASNTPSYSAENHFISKHIEFKIASDMSSLDGASATTIQKVDISISKNLQEVYKLGSKEPVDIANTVLSIEGNIEAKFDATTLKAIREAGTNKAIRIDITNSDVTIGSSSNPKLRIDLANATFQDWDKSGGLDDLIGQVIKFKAHYSLSDAKIGQMVLTNEQSSY